MLSLKKAPVKPMGLRPLEAMSISGGGLREGEIGIHLPSRAPGGNYPVPEELNRSMLGEGGFELESMSQHRW
jgi:hypothetical protein